MTPQELDSWIEKLLETHLNLENGEMMLPLKGGEIDFLGRAIRELALQAARDGIQ
jgi:hypothetical protein